MIRLFQFLVERGISRKEAATWIRELDDGNYYEVLSKESISYIMIQRIDEFVICRSETWGEPTRFDIEKEIDDAYIVNFRRIREEVDRAIEG